MSRFRPKSISQSDTDALVQCKLRWILEGCKPTRIFLFGSAARNELTDHSDVDFAILFVAENELREARKSIFGHPRNDDWPQEILLFLESEFERKSKIGGVCAVIAEEGKLLYSEDRRDESV